jgi:ABC-type spermidine/putrescine transport system permease subunit II
VTPAAPIRVAVQALAGLTLGFLVLPILAVVPASVNPLPGVHRARPGAPDRRGHGDQRRPLLRGQRAGLVGTTLGMAIGHTLMALPFVVQNVGVSLHGFGCLDVRERTIR